MCSRSEKGWRRLRVWFAAGLCVSMLGLLGGGLLGDEAEEPILSPTLVADLQMRCDPDEIYERAWEGTLQGLSPEEVDTFDFDRLGAEVMQILAGCFERELAAFDCEMACADLDEGMKRLTDLYAKYFFFASDDRFLGIDTSSLFPSEGVPAWDDYQEKLEACYRSVFESCACEKRWTVRGDVPVTQVCECDLERLRALWIDLALDDLNPFEEGMALADEVLAKYEECLIEHISTMTNVYEMARLIFEEHAGSDTPYSVVRGDTVYNNYTVACAILKRLIELYDLDVEDVDRLCSPCCDTVWLLKWLIGWIGQYHLMGYPERDRREWSNWDQDNLNRFRRRMDILGDPYTICRKHQLEVLAAECDPNAFCRILACREHGVVGHRDALEAQLADPREREFLEAFEARLEECLGQDVELEDVIEWCTTTPANKSWESLEQLARDRGPVETSAQVEPGIPVETTATTPPGEPESTPPQDAMEAPLPDVEQPVQIATTAPITVPDDIAAAARILAWKGGQLGRTDPSQRWSADEHHPGEFCEPCGHTPMCEVCMEWDLEEWQLHRRKSVTDLVALMALLSYLAQVSGGPEYQAVASIYWDAHWDGWHNRNRPW